MFIIFQWLFLPVVSALIFHRETDEAFGLCWKKANMNDFCT